MHFCWLIPHKVGEFSNCPDGKHLMAVNSGFSVPVTLFLVGFFLV